MLLFFQEPVQKTLGTTLSSQGGGRTRRRLFKTHSFCFIPFIQNVVALLSNDSLRKTMLEAKCKNANGKFEYIQDGAVLSNHPLFSRSRTATLEIILYSDEIELCNAVGTRVKKHKLLMFYYIIGNLPKMYRSVLSAINLYAVVRTEDVATYGFDTILQPLLEDMPKLSRAGGYPIELKGGELIHINAGLVAYIVDNPAAHQAIGLKESVGGAFRKCRFCHADYDAMQKGFCEEDFDPRNLEQHLQQCDVIRNATQALKDHFRTAYGINRKSILCDFPHFDIFKQTPPDVMHVLLEGVIPLTLQALIKHFINSKQTTLVEINNGIENFLYGYMENKDKPNLIRQQDLQSSSTCLNQDAAKSHLLFQIFPFIAGKNIDPNDDHWTLYTLLAEITDISFAPVISLETIAKLKEAVRGYLTLFKELFSEQPFTPKQHYLVHLPKVILLLGPLINLWAMRFEAKHQYFKQLKKILNFKNLSLSLCRHHQKLAAISRNSMLKENVYGPVRQLQGEELSRTKQRISSTLSIQENSINILESFKWIIIHGTKYMVDKCYLAVKFDNEENPVFGKLCNILEANTSLVVFDVIFLETVGFDDSLRAFEVQPQASGIVSVIPDMLLTHTPLPVYSFNGHDYIKLKCDISDLKD